MLSSIKTFKEFYEWVLKNRTNIYDDHSASEYYRIFDLDIEFHFTSQYIEAILTLEDISECRMSFRGSDIQINGTNVYIIEELIEKTNFNRQLQDELQFKDTKKKLIKV